MNFRKKYLPRVFFKSDFFLKSIPVILFIFFSVNIKAQDKKDKIRIDSIFTAIKAMPEDTQTVNYIIKIYEDYIWQFNLPEAYNKLKYAAKLSIKLDYDNGLYRAYHSMAGYCTRTGNAEFSIENRLKALEIAKRQNDSTKIVVQWVGIGLGYNGMHLEDSALIYYFKAKPFTEKSGNKDRIARLNLFLGWAYQELGKDSIAITYALRGLELRKEINYTDGIFSSLGSVRSIYTSLHDYENALKYSKEEYDLSVKTKNEDAIGFSLVGVGEIEEKLNKPDSALADYNKALAIFIKLNDRIWLRDVYRDLASVYETKGDSVSAYKYYKMHIALKDSIETIEAKITKERTKEIYDLESKNAEIDLKEKDIEEQKKSLIGLALILGISCILGIIIFIGYRQKKKIAVDLRVQKKVVEEKNLDITNSIVYAKRIQQAILPSSVQIKKALPDSFILYHPKDIVSGDFFWFNETTDSYYIAAVDCTGHGVPGALMSMIGFNFLNQIMTELKSGGTAEILNALHRKVLFALNKDFSSHEVKDGMDLALLRIFKNKNEVEFSGAVRPLYIVENNIPVLIKGDIYSIGGIKDADAESFSSHLVTVSKGTNLYLFSDGFADQFGGPNGKKFKYKQLKELFNSIHNLPMEEQKIKLNESFESWKGNLEQVDDVLVIGVKI